MRIDPRPVPLAVVIVSLFPPLASAQIVRVSPSPTTGQSAAVVVAGQLPLLHTTQLFPAGPDGRLAVSGDAAAQSTLVLERLQDVLRRYKLPLAQVVKLNLAAKDPAALEALRGAVVAAFGDKPPAITQLVSELGEAGALVALDAVAALPPETHQSVAFGWVDAWPRLDHHAGILPAGQRIYISGQAEPGELLVATTKTMESLAKTLDFLKLTPAAIDQVKAFVNPMSRAGEVRREIAGFFDQLPVPPIVSIDWKFDTPIEIECVAWGGPAADSRVGEETADQAGPADPLQFITPPWMKSSPVFSRIVRIHHGPIIYVGGLYGSAGASPDEQIKGIFEQLRTTLESADSDLGHLVKATYLCTETPTINSLGALRPMFYDPQRPPAASLSMITHTGRPGTTITLDMIAVPKPKGP